MSLTMDYLIKDTLRRILDEADEETISNMAETTNIPPEKLYLIRSYIDEELRRFYTHYKFFTGEDEDDES